MKIRGHQPGLKQNFLHTFHEVLLFAKVRINIASLT